MILRVPPSMLRYSLAVGTPYFECMRLRRLPHRVVYGARLLLRVIAEPVRPTRLRYLSASWLPQCAVWPH
jgi:hypothetical protein